MYSIFTIFQQYPHNISTIFKQYFHNIPIIIQQHYNNIPTIFAVCQWVRFPPWRCSFPLPSEVVTSIQNGFTLTGWHQTLSDLIETLILVCLLCVVALWKTLRWLFVVVQDIYLLPNTICCGPEERPCLWWASHPFVLPHLSRQLSHPDPINYKLWPSLTLVSAHIVI